MQRMSDSGDLHCDLNLGRFRNITSSASISSSGSSNLDGHACHGMHWVVNGPKQTKAMKMSILCISSNIVVRFSHPNTGGFLACGSEGLSQAQTLDWKARPAKAREQRLVASEVSSREKHPSSYTGLENEQGRRNPLPTSDFLQVFSTPAPRGRQQEKRRRVTCKLQTAEGPLLFLSDRPQLEVRFIQVLRCSCRSLVPILWHVMAEDTLDMQANLTNLLRSGFTLLTIFRTEKTLRRSTSHRTPAFSRLGVGCVLVLCGLNGLPG